MLIGVNNWMRNKQTSPRGYRIYALIFMQSKRSTDRSYNGRGNVLRRLFGKYQTNLVDFDFQCMQ